MSRASAAAQRAPAAAARAPFADHAFALAGASAGLALHYWDEGPRAAEPVLCLHGNPSSRYLFRHLIGALADRWRVIAPDHIGCGASDKPGDARYRLEAHIDNLAQLVEALDLRDITLVLHDWGGAIGMGLAARAPERIARLVITNTAAFRSRALPWRIAACRWPLVGPLALRGANAFVRAALHMAVEKPLAPEDARAYLAPFADWKQRAAQLAFVRDIPTSPRHPSWSTLVAIEQALPRFAELPALIAWGERDFCFTPAFRAEWQRRFPRAEVLRFEQAGHWLFEDEREALPRAIRAFLAAHSRR